MTNMGRILFIVATALALNACAKAPLATVSGPERELIASNLMRDITALASDEFGGRKPGTDGEDRTVVFLIEEMQAAGLVSGTNDPGSAWRAPVELVSTIAADSEISFGNVSNAVTLGPEQGAAFTTGFRLLIDGGEMVFVGREAESVAQDQIAGKVVVMLGEPGVSPGRRTKLFESGPAAIITVIEDGIAIANVNRVNAREMTFLASEEEKRLSAFVTQQVMADLLGAERWQMLRDSADSEGFIPFSLDPTVSIEAVSTRREFTSSNVLGLLPGAVPESGAVLLLAHWDHLGECGSQETGDLICNGAVDNASGIAVMLELARRLSAGGPHDRDIYVLATSSEELGLLGAKAFAAQPPIPLETVVAAFNFDTAAVAPAGSRVGFVGEGRTVLDELILEVMDASGRELGNREFAESFVRRQDGWALLEEGVPAVFLSTAFGSETVINPYLTSDYHRPSDDIENIELGGAIDDLLLHEELVRRVASTTLYNPPASPISGAPSVTSTE